MCSRNDRRPARRLATAAALLAVLAAGPAAAERADRNKPMNIEADRVSIDDAKKLSTFEGNVVVTQGTLNIRADRMVVRQDAEGFNHGIAWGNLASFRQKRDGVDEYVEGYAERIEYDGKAERLQMFNRAMMKRGEDEVRGSYISYDQPTEFFRVVGAGKEGGKENPPGRVRAVIQPKTKEKPVPPPSLPLKPAESMAIPRE